MRRLLDVLFGLVILVFMIYFIFDYLNLSGVQPFIDDMESTSWFPYVLYVFMALMVIIGITLIIIGLRPTKRSNRLVWETETGNLEIQKVAVESFIKKVISDEPNVVHHDTTLTFRSNKNEQTIEGSIDVLWAASMHHKEPSIQKIDARIKEKLSEFTQADCSGLNLNVLDQHKDTTRRVI